MSGITSIVAAIISPVVKFGKEVGQDLKRIEERRIEEAQMPQLSKEEMAEAAAMFAAKRARQQNQGK